MADYWVYHGAGGSNDGSSWTNAFTSWDVGAAVTALAITGNRFFVADDHVDPGDGTAKTHVGPSSGGPVVIISADRADTGSVPAYKKGTTAQFNTTDGAYNLLLNGSFALYGVRLASGSGTFLDTDNNEVGLFDSCDFVPPAGGGVTVAAVVGTRQIFYKCRFILSADSSNQAGSVILGQASGHTEFYEPVFVDATYRTGGVFSLIASRFFVSGADFSGFSNATLCEPALRSTGHAVFNNCKLTSAAAASPVSAGSLGDNYGAYVLLTNCSTVDAPESLYFGGQCGTVASSTVTRTGGATVAGVAHSWKVGSSNSAFESAPLYTPWIYGVIASAGSKTFTVYATNETADLTDAEIWLEVEYLGTADSPLYTLATDKRATITTGATAQTDDTASSWTGVTGTYKQSLAVTATVGEAGQYRARVAVGRTSLSNLYIDPKVTVS
jgi:hypothetical protein